MIIGERINPTGRSSTGISLTDIGYILSYLQQDAGAHITDVNVGLPDIDEPALMREVVQEACTKCNDLPLQIDAVDINYRRLCG